jgi:hypothetical protein
VCKDTDWIEKLTPAEQHALDDLDLEILKKRDEINDLLAQRRIMRAICNEREI